MNTNCNPDENVYREVVRGKCRTITSPPLYFDTTVDGIEWLCDCDDDGWICCEQLAELVELPLVDRYWLQARTQQWADGSGIPGRLRYVNGAATIEIRMAGYRLYTITQPLEDALLSRLSPRYSDRFYFRLLYQD